MARDLVRWNRTRRRAASAVLIVVLALGGVAGLGRVDAAPGDSRAEPAAVGEVVAAGPWRMSVLEVVTGADATGHVLAASGLNGPPREGFDYVVIRVRAENTGDRPLAIDGDDFGLTGSSGLVRRFAGAIAPDPALDARVGPGEATEGWVALGAPSDETNLLLLFDPLTLAGNWADRLFALQQGAAIADGAAPVAAANLVGVDPAAPAGLNEAIVTEDWQVEVLEIVQGDPVFDLVDFRTQALGRANAEDPTDGDGDGAVGWLALRIRVTNVRAGGEPAFFSPTALTLADASGAALLDALVLTPPVPAASGAYYAGASREGWVAFELPATYVAAGAALIRFLPYRTAPDPRYLTWR